MLIERKHTADLIPADYNPRKDWEHISRAKSWTPEMKEIARQRALAQRRGEKWQEP